MLPTFDSGLLIFWETFHGNFMYSQSFCQKSKFFLLEKSWNDFTPNKPTRLRRPHLKGSVNFIEIEAYLGTHSTVLWSTMRYVVSQLTSAKHPYASRQGVKRILKNQECWINCWTETNNSFQYYHKTIGMVCSLVLNSLHSRYRTE